jgi:hypothetical protein
MIKEGIDSWLHQRTNNRKGTIQDELGWEPFFYGYIAADLGHTQARHISKQKKQQPENKQTSYKWAMNLIQFLWQQSHLAWSQRNKEIHDNTEEAKELQMANITKRLKAIYSLRDELKEYDKKLFTKDIDEMLLEKPFIIKRWIETNETYIRHRYRLTMKHKDIQQTTIDDFFKQKPTQTVADPEPPAAPDPEQANSGSETNNNSDSDSESDTSVSNSAD